LGRKFLSPKFPFLSCSPVCVQVIKTLNEQLF